ncbi:hypothetical protein P8625_02910 [Tenacibaculum tangerinum]|uniref:Uncharacterized protein n=1 Tax=Tenacibaculum tangerinum TaxID=3038772 RepID=A0ABY8L3Y2_9FLAO|nr:hypothetical protein [Tenacibaculum tangerinum]WGH76134.1 hypothetical protein P8625_02910 [Tenacibaculum tangerinum]
MLNYSLNYEPIQLERSILPTSSNGSLLSSIDLSGGITPTTLEDNFYSTLDSVLGSIPGGSLVSGAMDFIGMGPREWSEVQEYEQNEWNLDLQYAQEKYLNNTSISLENRLSMFDMYLNAYIQYNVERQDDFKSSNSIKGRQYRITLVKETLSNFRSNLSLNYNASPLTENVTKYDIRNRNKTSLLKWISVPITYNVYTPKTSMQPVQSVDISGSPVQNVGTPITSNDVSIPTDSPYYGNSSQNNETPFNWLFVIIPAVGAGLFYLGKVLYKKFKKNKQK